MDKQKEIEELKLIIAENLAMYSKVKMPYEEALKMCALGILASGYGNIKQAVREFAEKLKEKVFRYEEVDGEDICDDIDQLIKELYSDES